MADNIGVLGSATTATVGTTTAYTCPASKSAKVKIMWLALTANTGTLAFAVNGITIATIAASSGAEYWWSTTTVLKTEAGTPTNAPDGTTALLTVAPAPFEYYLSAGDTVTYTIGVANCTSINVQVVGAELDSTL
jgi:hypothetical protein